jgi:hypothetical protein
MALGGMQGLDSKQPDARELIGAMAELMEKSEVRQREGAEEIEMCMYI